ncbi:DUF5367 family protein [Fulvivirga lutimaris]|uniref:DUF5367 family protein n=1 Tax=Fulvivirga lutimaris TaxID=1819566 RepID=UPI0012BB6BEB|nr:DUF5367 family protein [Fulvivirga lutimaris]MTI41666.1 hypothetical protein [Fulvivirga lutimaris]
MKNLNIKRAIISSIIVYVLLIPVFIGSFYVPILKDPDLQANLALMAAMLPAAYFAAHFYYRKGPKTNGLILGCFMFLMAIILDAVITVPVFIIPLGGDHLSFFSDISFWLIGLEYIAVIAGYWRFKMVKTANV